MNGPRASVVVDPGATDGAVEIARSWCDRLVEIPAERLTYGRAANLGAEAAGTPSHSSLSANCEPGGDDWVERGALDDWWTPPDDRHSALFHRLNHRRTEAILGKHRGLAPTRRRGS